MTIFQPERRKLIAWSAIAAVVVLAIVARVFWHRADGSNESARQTGQAAVPVTTAVAAKENVPIYLTAIGTVQAAESVTVKARVDGQLEKLSFSEGKDVRTGELLAQIDARPFQAQLDQALAQKAHDEAQLGAALKDLERYETLVKQDSIQQQLLDTQLATVGQLKASVQGDQAQIDNARVQLGYTRILSPIDGRTGIRLIDAGNIVHASDANGIVVVNKIDPIALIFTLPEDSFQTVNAAVQTYGEEALQVQALGREDGVVLGVGKLLLINNQIDRTTGTYQLKALFPNGMHKLWPGQYVNVHLLMGERRDATTVPETALQRGPNGLLIYVVKPDDTIAVQLVRVAQTQDGKAIIDEGVTPGTRVVTDGQYKVRPGVKVIEAAQAAARTSTPQ